MTNKQWERLESLNDYSLSRDFSDSEQAEFTSLFHMTEKEADHPEEWEWPCLCYECRSSE